MEPGLWLTSFWVEMPSIHGEDTRWGKSREPGSASRGRGEWGGDLRAVRFAHGAWVWPGWQKERACPQAWRWRPGRGRIQRDGLERQAHFVP